MEGFKLDGMSWHLHQVLSLSVDVGLPRNSPYFCIGEVGGDESYPWGGPGVTSEFYSRADSRCGLSKVTRWSSFFFFFSQLSCFMPWIPLFFDWMVILKSSALNTLMEETRHREFLLIFLALICWLCSRFIKVLFMAFFVHCVLQCVGKSLYGAASRAAGVQRRWKPRWQKGSSCP